MTKAPNTVTASPTLAGITGFRLETFLVGSTIGAASANGNFVLSEFLVDDGSNLALGRPVTASAAIYSGTNPVVLTDGNPTSYLHGNSGTATTFAYTVDLGQPVSVDQIDLFNRNDGCCTDRLTNYRVSLHDDANGSIGNLVWSADVRTDGTNSGKGGIDQVPATMGVGTPIGQWVKVEKIDDGTQNYWLQAAEIQVQGDYLKNYALKAPVTTSGSVYGSGFSADRLTDGNLDSYSHPADSQGIFSYDIDLGKVLDFNSLYVYNRNDGCCTDRLSDYTVSIHLDDNGSLGTEVWSAVIRGDDSNSGSGGVDSILAAMDPTGSFMGQWIRLTGPGDVNYAPQIAEVQAFGTLVTTAAVPEPSSLFLAGLGICLLGIFRQGYRPKVR